MRMAEGDAAGQQHSPLLANVYLHYAFDCGSSVGAASMASGDMIVVSSRTTSCSDSSTSRMPSGSGRNSRTIPEFRLGVAS